MKSTEALDIAIKMLFSRIRNEEAKLDSIRNDRVFQQVGDRVHRLEVAMQTLEVLRDTIAEQDQERIPQ